MRLHRASRSRTVDGTLLFQILRFSVPLALTGILQLVFNAMDNLVVGKFSGASALAAVGTTTSLVHLIVGAFNGMSIGANIVVARAIGGEQDDQIKRAVNCAFALSGILGVAVMCLGVPLSSTMLAWMGTPEEILPLSARYLQIYFLGAPALVVFNFAAAVLRAYNDTTHPLLILSGCGVVNVALNLLFVIQLRMDVAGVALATTISQYLSLILILVFFLKANGTMKLRIRSVRLYPREAVDILAAGFPAGIQVIVFNTANVLIQSSVNIFGTHVIAANTASGSLCGFVYTAMNSVYHASVTFTSRAMGNRNYSAIPKLLNICLTAVFLIYLPLALVVSAFCPQLLGIFLSRKEPGYEIIIQQGVIRTLYCVIPYFVCGFMEVLCGVIRGMGRAWLPMIVSTIGSCLVRILWIATIFRASKSLTVLYLVFPVSWIITAAMHLGCFAVLYRRLIRNDKNFARFRN